MGPVPAWFQPCQGREAQGGQGTWFLAQGPEASWHSAGLQRGEWPGGQPLGTPVSRLPLRRPLISFVRGASDTFVPSG